MRDSVGVNSRVPRAVGAAEYPGAQSRCSSADALLHHPQLQRGRRAGLDAYGVSTRHESSSPNRGSETAIFNSFEGECPSGIRAGHSPTRSCVQRDQANHGACDRETVFVDHSTADGAVARAGPYVRNSGRSRLAVIPDDYDRTLVCAPTEDQKHCRKDQSCHSAPAGAPTVPVCWLPALQTR